MSRRVVLAGAAAVVLGAGSPASALAHQGSPNMQSDVTRVTPAVAGVELAVLNRDDRLQLTNRSGQTVTVQGYNGEPYLRILGDGTVQLNRHSQAYYLNADRYLEGVSVPPEARRGAVPLWRTVDRTGRVDWHDHRIHYMVKGRTPPAVTDRGKRTHIFDWSVPLRVGARTGAIQGRLTWIPSRDGLGLVGGGAGVAGLGLAAVGAVVLMRRRRRLDDARDADAPAQAGEAW